MKDGVNGLLVDFFSPGDIADRVDEVLNHHDRMGKMRERARKTAVEHFDFKSRMLPRWKQLLQLLMDGKTPPVDMMG